MLLPCRGFVQKKAGEVGYAIGMTAVAPILDRKAGEWSGNAAASRRKITQNNSYVFSS